MNLRKLILLLALFLATGVGAQIQQQSPYPKREFRGAWIQAVNGQFRGIPSEKLKQTLIDQLNSLQGAGINAIIFQVRPEADALYASQLEPWSRFLTGVQGQAPSPYWDPMQFMIDECHKRGMEFHAWINPYRKTLPHIRFVDTIGLVCPFLHQCDFSDLAIRQIEEYDHCLWEEVFPPHAYDLASHKPLGVFDWARGWGWYVLGLIETADLPGNKKRILNLSNHLLPFQKADGGFSCLVFNPNERFESSGSALFGLLFVHAYRVSGDERYLNAAIKIEKALMKATRRDGTIDFAQGDTKGIGSYSQIFDRMPFAQGMGLYLSKTLDIYEKTIG